VTVILYLIIASVGIGGGGLLLFLWALRSGQFEDLDGAAGRILFEDDDAGPSARGNISPGQPRASD
jgi:cbb3-type cytochrome oxidase maturation protein